MTVSETAGGSIAALTEVALQEGKRCFVGKVNGELGVDLPFELQQLPDPVTRQEGEVWETLVDCSSEEEKQSHGRRRIASQGTALLPVLPDGDHLPLGDVGVQLLHFADVRRPLELFWVDEEDRLFYPGIQLVL